MDGIGSVQFCLDSGGLGEVKEVLYVLGLEKNLLSILVMENKGIKVCFTRGEVFVRLKGANICMRQVIGNREKNLYFLGG